MRTSCAMCRGFSLLDKIEFSHRSFLNCGGAPAANSGGSTAASAGAPPAAPAGGGCMRIDDVTAVLGLPRDVNETAWLDAGVMLAYLVFLRLAIYYVLQRRTRTAFS